MMIFGIKHQELAQVDKAQSKVSSKTMATIGFIEKPNLKHIYINRISAMMNVAQDFKIRL